MYLLLSVVEEGRGGRKVFLPSLPKESRNGLPPVHGVPAVTLDMDND
jgi:hypothetical protein